MSDVVSSAVVQVTQADAYRFVVSFPGNDFEPIVGDEPAPLGKDGGPNPVRSFSGSKLRNAPPSAIRSLGLV